MKSYFIFLVLSILFASQVAAQEVFDSLFLLGNSTVYFESDSAELDSNAIKELDTIIELSKTSDSTIIKVISHTDNVGSDRYNKKLSESRAQSVNDLIRPQLSELSILVTNALGETSPLNNNKTEEDKSNNRRVEIEIYHVKKLIWLSGKVVDEENIAIGNAAVRLHSKSHSDSTMTDVNGDYRLSSPINEGVGLDIIAIDQMPKLIFKKVTPQSAAKPLIIRTEKIEVGKKFSFRTLYFEGSRAIILRKSMTVLPTLKEFMIINKGTCVRIEGHINYPNIPNLKRQSQSFQLSIARSKTIFDYLRDEVNVHQDRMRYQGFGNWRMVFPKAVSAEEQQKNRRVEIIIASCEETKTEADDILVDEFDFYEKN